ncbi:MAG: hypothetical protein LBI08_00385 [Methanomassiliicoccaceae archaeon]|jgi:uncharacterized membrane protein YbaN (DUF454 family)|nr:hypothetical protein [Methanomassiliicoccaceae archaeon]
MVTKKNDEGTINDMFDEEPAIPLEAQLWGKNPKRTQLLRDIWLNHITEQLDEEKNMPEEAKRELLFMMAVNSVLDMAMESLPDELSLELSYCMDHMMGVSVVNQKYGVDLLETNYEVLSKIKREDFETDEEFEKAVHDKEEKWWSVGKQQLSGRSPNDAIAEALSRYGLNR